MSGNEQGSSGKSPTVDVVIVGDDAAGSDNDLSFESHGAESDAMTTRAIAIARLLNRIQAAEAKLNTLKKQRDEMIAEYGNLSRWPK